MNGKLLRVTVAAAAAAATTLCSPAGAADISAAPYAPPPPPLMLYNWTGFHVGAHFGGAFGSDSESLGGGTFSATPSGVMGGLQFGYDFQFAPTLVAGVEAELSWTSAQDSAAAALPGIGLNLSSTHNWYDTLTARLGYAMGTWLFYAKFGAAWMNADYTLTATAAGIGGTSSFNATRPGFAVGAGAEYAFNPAWSAKVEYQFLDFGTDNFAYPIGIPVGIDTYVHEVKLGVNYHFVPGAFFSRFY
jgi:outer membrane autotransporter protein